MRACRTENNPERWIFRLISIDRSGAAKSQDRAQRITSRQLKPANIKGRPDGTVIAKANTLAVFSQRILRLRGRRARAQVAVGPGSRTAWYEDTAGLDRRASE